MVAERKIMATSHIPLSINGRLNPAARGWSVTPAIDCSIEGHTLRKKKWNHWAFHQGSIIFTAAIVHMDYIAQAFSCLVDLDSGQCHERIATHPLGFGCFLGDKIEDNGYFRNSGLGIRFEEGGTRIIVQGKVSADIKMEYPSGYESLNAVIPWDDEHFDFTSKQNCIPASGSAQMAGRTIRFDRAYASLDFQRGVWPYHTFWNWASASAGNMGLNLGGGWTDGTGINENAFWFEGKLYKLPGDVRFTYADLLKPWRIQSDQLDLTFTPVVKRIGYTNVLFIMSRLIQIFGRFTGQVRLDEKTVPVDVIGCVEEHRARW